MPVLHTVLNSAAVFEVEGQAAFPIGRALRGVALFFATCLCVSMGVNAATINVTSGMNLNLAMETALDNDTILVGPGTYTVGSTPTVGTTNTVFRIRKKLTVKSTNGPATTILQAGAGQDYAVHFHPMVWGGVTHSPNGASLEGFTLVGAKGGVLLHDYQNVGVQLDNITLKNLIITPDVTPSNPSHGISFENVINSRIDATTITSAYNNGIYIHLGSNNSLTSNVVQNTIAQHAIALSSSNNNTVLGNTISGSAFHGVIVLASNGSQIVGNSISGHKYDGITLTDSSNHSFIANNRIVSSGYANGLSDGSGIWLNAESDGNMVYANDMSGSPETGLAVFLSSSNLMEANSIHDQSQGGILVWYSDGSFGVGGRPSNNLIRSNRIYHNRSNTMVNIRGALSTDVAYNFMSPLSGFGNPADAGFGAGGVIIDKDDVRGASDKSLVYGNVIADTLADTVYVKGNSTNSKFYRNRFFNTKLNYATPPATVAWDGGSVLGGNYWSDHAAVGNPSTATPYTKFIYDSIGHLGGGYADNYPFQSETFGVATSVALTNPHAGQVVAAGSTKTIRWDSVGCVYVDLALLNSGGVVTSTLATNYPDMGHYMWDSSAALAAGSYLIKVSCKNSAGQATGTSAQSGAFSIATAGLKLLSPVAFASQKASDTVVVSWARTTAVTGGVDVYLTVDGVESLKASTVTGNFVSFATPATVSNRASVRIVSGAYQDAVDGYFPLLASSGAGFTGITSGQNVSFGNKFKLEWKSLVGSNYVDIDLWNGTAFQSIAQNVADFGRYDWYVLPAYIANGQSLRLTFKSALTTGTLGTASSNSFNIVDTSNVVDLSVSQSVTTPVLSAGKDVVYQLTVSNGGGASATAVNVIDTIPAGASFVWASPGCANASGTVTCNLGNVAGGASTQIKLVVRPAAAGTMTNILTVSSAQVDANSANNTSTGTSPVNSPWPGTGITRYRLYSPVTLEHHYTTDLNEYSILGGNGNWVQEGPVGKVFNNPGVFNGATVVPYYRLYNLETRWHHWTTDANEYYTLSSYSHWVGENVDGYILLSPTTGAVPLYRLLFITIPGLHHWTIDANENSVLINGGGWAAEGGAYVIQ